MAENQKELDYPNWKFIKAADFPVNGQGTFILTSSEYLSYKIVVTSEKVTEQELENNTKPPRRCFTLPDTYIALDINKGFQYDAPEAQFVIKEKKEDNSRVLKKGDDGLQTVQKKVRSDGDESNNWEPRSYYGTHSKYVVGYWFSYDRDTMTLKYGKGHRMKETTLLQYDFLAEAKGDAKKEKELWKRYKPFFNAETSKRVIVYGVPDKSLHLEVKDTIIDHTPLFQFRPNPLVNDYPPLVKDSSEVTLFDLDRGQYMFSSSLPSACRELYGNIKNLILDYPENPIMKLSDAIRYSIVTEGKLLNQKLKDKSNEFDGPPQPNETYLRVTLGPDSRTGPGIPYVLEIWPSGHYSPIHNHGNACAIIKVLFGRINVGIFNQQISPIRSMANDLSAPEPEAKGKFDAKEGDVTWISPDWFQTHQLMNNTDDFCATIQCYRYSDEDNIHWPGFDYFAEGSGQNDKDHLDVFYPDSDFTFLNMRSKVLAEYQEYLGGPKCEDKKVAWIGL